jgi:aryl-alcohol dehydrogenase-like predicted oxidoreductase
MKLRRLGNLAVADIGSGTMSCAATYGEAPDEAASIRVIRGAHECDVTLFDTAEAYGPRTNEVLVGKALTPVRDKVVIATRFDRNIDLLYRHRVDPAVPIEGVAGTIRRIDADTKIADADFRAFSPRFTRQARACQKPFFNTPIAEHSRPFAPGGAPT